VQTFKVYKSKMIISKIIYGINFNNTTIKYQKKINNKFKSKLYREWFLFCIGIEILFYKIKCFFKYKTTDLNKVMIIKMSNKND